MSLISNIMDRRHKKNYKKIINAFEYAKKYNLSESDFTFFKEKSQLESKTQRTTRRPVSHDTTEKLTANVELCLGFYRNEYPGLKLAGSFAKIPINKPAQFMGLPIPIAKNANAKKVLVKFVEDNSETIKGIHKLSHICGTYWVWPWYDSESGNVMLECILDSAITQIIKNPNTLEVVELYTDEELEISTGEDTSYFARRKRHFTKQTISIKYENVGAGNIKLENVTYLNPIGILPIAYANDKQPGRIRGISDYANWIMDAKNYHDVYARYTKMLAQFNIKLIQKTSDVASWETNNGVTLDELDIYNMDLILNTGEDKSDYIFPNGAFDSYEKILSLIFWKIIQGSNIPEIFWGLNAQGNHASVTESMSDMVKYVNDKRYQHNQSYVALFTAVLKLYGIATMENITEENISIEWNMLDALDEKTRAEIFNNFAAAVSSLINSAGCTKKQLFALWSELYPQATDEKYMKWVEGLSEMAKHKAFSAEPYNMIIDLAGNETDIDVISERDPVSDDNQNNEDDSSDTGAEYDQTTV